MKWIKKLLLVAPLMLLLISGTAYAKNNVSEIDISVTVRDDGTGMVLSRKEPRITYQLQQKTSAYQI